MSLIADTASIATDAAKLRDIVQGDYTTEVQTDGGVVPSLAKLLTSMGAGTLRGAWVTATAYALSDVVTNGGSAYRALVAHTSAGAFATDLAANKWVVHYSAGLIPGIRIQTPSSTTSEAGLVLPHGVAPTTPVDGDMWTTTAGLYVRINGATVGPLAIASTLTEVNHWGKITNPTVVAITAATAATLNRMHNVSGLSGAYTITLSGLSPAVGDVVGFRVADYTAASAAYQLDAGGTVKIAGRTRYLHLVHTNVVLLQWDGTDWRSLVLCLDTPWVDGGAVVPSATTSAPTKGTTSVDKMWWRRIGDSAQFRYEYVQSAGGTNGSGTYLLPFLFTADTSKINITGTGTVDEPRNVVGTGQTTVRLGNVMLYDSLRVYFQGISDVGNGLWGSAHIPWSGARFTQLNFTLPIANW
jgi:hypothetical protein